MSSSSTRRRGIGAVIPWIALLLVPALAFSRDTQSTTGLTLTQALSTVDNVSARAALSANDAVFDAAARVRLMIEALESSAKDILDKEPGDLDAAQKRTLEGIQTALTALKAAADQPADQARQRIDEIRQLSRGSVPDSRQPLVLSSSPAILVPSAANEIVFAVTGLKLAKADPQLLFGEGQGTRTSLTDEQAVFSLPSSILRSDDRTPIAYSGRVLLSGRNCGWLRCRPSSKAYTVAVVVLPTHLATVRIGFTRKKTERIYEQTPVAESAPVSSSSDMIYRKRFEYSTDDLTVMSCTRESQAPHAAGYSIDTGTLSANVVDRSGETKWSLVEASANGFSVELCAQPQIDRMGKTTGSIALEATWKEYRVGEVISPREWLPPAELSWGGQVKESLPQETNDMEVDLEYFDGSRASFTQTSNDRYVELKWDAQTHQLVLTPHLRSSLADAE